MARRPGNPDIPALNGVAASAVSLPTTKPAPWATVLDYLAHRMHQLDGAIAEAQDFIKDACQAAFMTKDAITNAREGSDAMRQI